MATANDPPLPLLRLEPLAHRRGEVAEVFRHGRALPAAVLGLLAALFVAGLAYALILPVSRTVTVPGTVEASEGLIGMHARQPGTVVRLHVEEGEQVAAGDPLVTVRRQHGVGGIQDLAWTLTHQLAQQRDLVVEELSAGGAHHEAELARLDRQQQQVRSRIELLERESSTLSRRLFAKRRQVKRLQGAVGLGAVPAVVLQQTEDDLLATEQSAVRLQAELGALEGQLDDLALTRQEARAAFRRLELQLQRDLRNIEMRMLMEQGAAGEVIRAPRAATVALVATSRGATAEPLRPLITLLPSDELRVRLLANSRATGWITVGQRARLTVDAYPFPDHGAVEGRVAHISPVPTVAGKPIYRLDVVLDEVPKTIVLKPGLTVTADIFRTSDTLAARLIEPLVKAFRRL